MDLSYKNKKLNKQLTDPIELVKIIWTVGPKGQSKDYVLEKIEIAHNVIRSTLSSLTEEQENEIFPSDFKGKMVKVNVALSHLLAHLAYHNGQINYLRRMLYV